MTKFFNNPDPPPDLLAEILTSRTPEYRHEPTLYFSEAGRDMAGGRITFGSLHFQVSEIQDALTGCLDILKSLRAQVNEWDYHPPLVAACATLKYAMDILWNITPCYDEGGHGFTVERRRDGAEVIRFDEKKVGP
jgi:hypothetical protein